MSRYGASGPAGGWSRRPSRLGRLLDEAVAALVDWARQNLRARYLLYAVDKRNVPSRKVAESLGGVVEAEYEVTNASGKILELVEYRIYP